MYFPEENTGALTYLEAHGYRELDRQAVEVLLFGDYTPQEERAELISINADNFDIFRTVHSQYENDMYWTSQRIEEHLDEWEILAYLDHDVCLGAIYHNGKGQEDLEIFGIDCDSQEIAEALLVGCLNRSKAKGAKSMYFFTEEAFRRAAERSGFRCVTVAHYFEGNGQRA